MKKSPPKSLDFRNALNTPLGQITMAGFSMRQTVGMSGWRTFGQYAVVYIQEGAGDYEDAKGLRRSLGPGDLVIVYPDLKHRYNPVPGTEWVASYLCFQGAVFDLWRAQGLLDSRQPLHHLEPVAEWSRRFEGVLSAPRQAGYAPPLHDLCRLQQLLADIVTGAGRATAYADDLRWVSRACSLIEAELGGPPDWAAVAHPLGLAEEGFRKRFTRLAGQPPARYRMSRLIDRACELMQAGRMTDAQIADALGFCDAHYFSRRFKEITGKSARAFRRELPR